MAGGEDTRNHPNRKVTKEALGKRYAEIGVGFDDVSDPELDGEWAIDEDAKNTIRKADEASRKTSTQTRYLHDKDY